MTTATITRPHGQVRDYAKGVFQAEASDVAPAAGLLRDIAALHPDPALETRLSDVLNSPPARPGCIPATTTERAVPVSLPLDKAKAGSPPSSSTRVSRPA